MKLSDKDIDRYARGTQLGSMSRDGLVYLVNNMAKEIQEFRSRSTVYSNPENLDHPKTQ